VYTIFHFIPPALYLRNYAIIADMFQLYGVIFK